MHLQRHGGGALGHDGHVPRELQRIAEALLAIEKDGRLREIGLAVP